MVLLDCLAPIFGSSLVLNFWISVNGFQSIVIN
jgi:hypothetical protein